ncbi:MAG TPA: hypothetical protein VFI22_08380 [Thermomicrobiales bacterium]|nr:hypothetical protein [Thermomicrobiales bacterium]
MASSSAHSSGWSRRSLVRSGAAAAVGAVAAGIPSAERAAAHNLPPGEFGSAAYDAALAASGGMKAIFQSPNIDATTVSGESLTHLLPLQLKNWLNGFQFSYQMDPSDLHTIVATYASANLLTYDDHAWQTYQFGKKYEIVDPATGQPATRNLFWPARNDAAAKANPDDPASFYQDVGIAALQQRGAVFLT